MTTVKFNDKGAYFEILAHGHNEDSRVCAAISFMLQTLVQLLLDHDVRVYYVLEPGKIDIKVDKHAMGYYSVECFYHMNFVRRGLTMLADQQPENVTFLYNEDEDDRGESK